MTPTPHRRRFSRASAALDWRIFRNRNRGACYPDPHPEALHGHHSRFTHARKKREGHPFLTLDATASTARRHSPLRGGVCVGGMTCPQASSHKAFQGIGALASYLVPRGRAAARRRPLTPPLTCHESLGTRGTARAPRTTRAAILKTGKATAGAIPSRPCSRARAAKPRHTMPQNPH